MHSSLVLTVLFVSAVALIPILTPGAAENNFVWPAHTHTNTHTTTDDEDIYTHTHY